VTPSQYLAATPEPKRSELAQLDTLIRSAVPSFEPFMAGSMIGYGKYHYRYDSGREGVSCRVGLAGTKTGISVYVTCVHEGAWLAEKWKDRLGKADVGKSCIRFKRLADIDLDALTKVLRIAHGLRAPGEIDDAATATPKKRATAKEGGAAKRSATKKVAAKAHPTKKTAAATPGAKTSGRKKAAAKKAPAKKK